MISLGDNERLSGAITGEGCAFLGMIGHYILLIMGLYSFMVKFVGLLNENIESLFVLPFRIYDRSLESQGVSDL